jgi:uncharacterized protein DUF3105
VTRWLERGAIVIASLAVSIGIIALLSGGLAGGRDQPGISVPGGGVPGRAYADQGDRHLAAGAPRPRYDSDPPTSGAHRPVAVIHNGAAISEDQLLQALSLGDVVFLYSSAAPPAGLQSIADQVAPRFTPALAAVGQTVILARRPGLSTIIAVAWDHMLRSDSAEELRAFAGHWLGHGAAGRTGAVVGND